MTPIEQVAQLGRDADAAISRNWAFACLGACFALGLVYVAVLPRVRNRRRERRIAAMSFSELHAEESPRTLSDAMDDLFDLATADDRKTGRLDGPSSMRFMYYDCFRDLRGRAELRRSTSLPTPSRNLDA